MIPVLILLFTSVLKSKAKIALSQIPLYTALSHFWIDVACLFSMLVPGQCAWWRAWWRAWGNIKHCCTLEHNVPLDILAGYILHRGHSALQHLGPRPLIIGWTCLFSENLQKDQFIASYTPKVMSKSWMFSKIKKISRNNVHRLKSIAWILRKLILKFGTQTYYFPIGERDMVEINIYTFMLP